MSRGWLRLTLLLVILGAFALRLWRLDGQELRGDEAFGYFFSLDTLPAIVEKTLDLGEPHPVASYWLQHGWLRLAGDGEFALRFQSVWWSTLAVALLARLGHALGLGARLAVMAALLMAVSPYALWHSQDARMYSMSLALTTGGVAAAVAWWAHPRTATAALYVLCALLALHTHYYAGFVLVVPGVVGLVWCYRARGTHAALGWLALQVGVALLYLPWLVVALSVVTGYGGNGDSPSLGDALARAGAAMALGEVELPPAQALWAGLLGLAAALGFGVLFRRGNGARAAAWLLLLYALIPILATWLGSRTRPIYDERYLVAAVPPVYLLAAAGGMPRPGRRPAGWPAPMVLALLLAGMAAGSVTSLTDPVYSKDRGWRELAGRLALYSQGYAPQAVRLVQNYPDPTLWYYYRGPVSHMVLPPVAHDAPAALALVEDLAQRGVRRVVFVAQPSSTWDAEGIALDSLERHFTQVAEVPLAGWTILILERPGLLQGMSAVYANGLKVAQAAIGPEAAVPGSVLAVHVQYDAQDARLAGSEKASIQVVDGSGALAAQVDVPLATGTQTTGWVSSYGILLPSRMSSAEVIVNLVIYDPAQERMARLLTAQGDEVVRLATLPVYLEEAPGQVQEEGNAGAP